MNNLQQTQMLQLKQKIKVQTKLHNNSTKKHFNLNTTINPNYKSKKNYLKILQQKNKQKSY